MMSRFAARFVLLRHHFYKIFMVLSFIFTTVLSNSAAGIESDLDAVHLDVDLDTDTISWFPGERYDPLTGTMGYQFVDFSFPGNGGLPIEIHRSFYQRGSTESYNPAENRPDKSFGMMDIAIPEVSFTLSSPTTSAGAYRGCAPSKTYMHNYRVVNDDNERDIMNVKTPFVFTDGESTVKFFKRPATGAERFPNNVHYVSANNWYLTCTDFQTGQGSTLSVVSPDNVIYKMIKVPNTLGQRILYRVSEIVDTYQNSLNYEYEVKPAIGTSGQHKLVRISSNDSREVAINYSRTTINNSAQAWRISSIVGNGFPNHRRVDYDYVGTTLTATYDDASGGSGQNLAVNKFEFNQGRLARIEYPTGGSVSYEYDSVLSQYYSYSISPGTRYNLLTSRTLHDGGAYRFEYHEEPGDSDKFNRIIRTPNTALQMQFEKSVAIKNGKGPISYSPNQGKLVLFKNLGNSTASYPFNGNAPVSKTFEYINLSSVASYSHPDADLNVLNSRVIQMNPIGGDLYKSIFTVEFSDHNEFGFPRLISESTNSTSANNPTARDIQNSYYTPNESNEGGLSGWFVGRLKDTSIDGVKQRSLTYNNHGDLEALTAMGVTTSTSYYETGPNAGEIKSISGGPTVRSFDNYFRGVAQYESDGENREISRSVNSDGTVASQSRLGGSENVVYEYDSRRRVKSIDPARDESATINVTWESESKRVEQTYGAKNYTKIQIHDGFGRLIADGKKDNANGIWATRFFNYDYEGKLTFESYTYNIDPVLRENATGILGIVYTHDELGRIKKVNHQSRKNDIGEDVVTNYYYEGSEHNQLTIRSVDGRDHTEITSYLSFSTPSYNLPIKIVQPDGTSVGITRDSEGKVLSVVRGDRTINYTYNSSRQLWTVTRPENGETSYYYHSYGLIDRIINNGQSITHSYNGDRQLTVKDYSDETGDSLKQTYSYDFNGNLGSITSSTPESGADVLLTYGYDFDDNLISESLAIDGGIYVMRYTYDELGSRSTVEYPSGRIYELSPSAFSRPTKIVEIGGSEKIIYSSIGYNDDLTMNSMSREGHEVINSLDGGQRPFYYSVKQNSGGRYNKLSERMYSYDKAANIARINDVVNSRYSTFEYDSRNRLKAEYTSDGHWTFDYNSHDDIMWMRKAGSEFTNFDYNPTNGRLEKATKDDVERVVDYDEHGNISKLGQLRAGNPLRDINLVYNSAHQLVETTGVQHRKTYLYDGRGLRVRQGLSSPIYSLYDANRNLVYRHDPAAQVSSEYFYVDGKLIARRDVSQFNDDSNSTDMPPGTPDLVGPQGSGVPSSPMYTWNSVPGAASYFIEIREGSNETVLIWKKYTATELNCAPGQSPKCKLERSDFPMSGVKRWRVRSSNNAGSSEWSAFSMFTVSDDSTQDSNLPPAVPSPSQPSGAGAPSNPTYSWAPVANVASYSLEVQDGSNDIRIYEDSISANSICDNSVCRFSKPTAPVAGQNRWRVLSKNSYGSSQWSPWVSFAVGGGSNAPIAAPAVPSPTSPAGSGQSSNPTYTWNAVDNAASYALEVQDGSQSIRIYEGGLESSAYCSNGSCAFTKENAPMANANRWRVSAANDIGNSSWSEWMEFSVGGGSSPQAAPAVPSPLTPNSSINTNDPEYQWNAVDTASSYYLEVQDANNQIRIWNSYNASVLGCEQAGSLCSIKKSDAPVMGINKWRIQSVNSVGNSSWSEWRLFNAPN